MTSTLAARARLRSAEAFLSGSAEQIYLCDRFGRLSYANRAAGLAWGLGDEEMLGRRFRELGLHSPIVERLAESCETALQSGRAQSHREAFRLGPSGERDYQGHFIPLVTTLGSVDGVVASLADVTEEERQLRLHRFLASAHQLLRAQPEPPVPLAALAGKAVEELADLCVVAVLDNGRVEWIELAQRGQEPDLALREYIRAKAFGHPEASVLARVAATGAPEVVSHARDARALALYPDSLGLRRWCGAARESYACVPLVSSGTRQGVLLLVTQGARRRILPKDLEALAAFGAHLGERLECERAHRGESRAMEILGVASHEIRTPLTLMRMQLDRLMRESRCASELGPTRQDRLESMSRQLSRVSRLVEDLLDVSRMGVRGVELDREPVDIAQLLRQVAFSFQEAFSSSGCELSVQVPDEPVVVLADRSRLEQVVSNLLTNALKYAPGTPVTVSLAQGDSEVALVVQDEGPGIPESQHVRIFQRFERAEGAEAQKGFGIGLWLVRQLVEAHGGKVTLRSAPGCGSEFRVHLPLNASRQEPLLVRTHQAE